MRCDTGGDAAPSVFLFINLINLSREILAGNRVLSIGGTFNLASIRTELAGRITIGGIGAGSVETASATLSDVLWIHQALRG